MNNLKSFKSLIIALQTVLPTSMLLAITQEDFNIFTYKEPPIVMYDEGVLYGVGTDVINRALEEIDIEDYYIPIGNENVAALMK